MTAGDAAADRLRPASNDPVGFRQAMSRLATGVTIITTAGPAGRAGMTASAVCSLSLEPIQLLVCVSTRLPTHAALERHRSFAVNVLGEGQHRLAHRFATPGIDKFASVALAEHDGLPLLRDAIAHFVCDVAERFPGGDHSIFIGRVREFGFDRDGRPLLCFGSGFGGLASTEDRLLRDAWLNPAAGI